MHIVTQEKLRQCFSNLKFVISFRYKITDLSGQGQYLVDMKLAVCFSDGAPCHMENTIVSNYLVTLPTCAWFTGYKVASKY